MEITIRRLTSNDSEEARTLFTLMSKIFAEKSCPLSDGYLYQLLNRKEFWAMAAFAGDEVVGGVTAHTLPMTKAESSEIFIYDIAVRSDYRRKGVGRRLLEALFETASEFGVQELFVAADNDDVAALDFYRAVGGTPSPVTVFGFAGD